MISASVRSLVMNHFTHGKRYRTPQGERAQCSDCKQARTHARMKHERTHARTSCAHETRMKTYRLNLWHNTGREIETNGPRLICLYNKNRVEIMKLAKNHIYVTLIKIQMNIRTRRIQKKIKDTIYNDSYICYVFKLY